MPNLEFVQLTYVIIPYLWHKSPYLDISSLMASVVHLVHFLFALRDFLTMNIEILFDST